MIMATAEDVQVGLAVIDGGNGEAVLGG